MEEPKKSIEEHMDEFYDVIDSEEELDVIDPDHEEYLDNEFQNQIIEDIYNEVLEYINFTAAPLCEYLTMEKLEIIIDNLSKI